MQNQLLRKLPLSRRVEKTQLNSESDSEEVEGDQKQENISIESGDLNKSNFLILKEEPCNFYSLSLIFAKNHSFFFQPDKKIHINLPYFL